MSTQRFVKIRLTPIRALISQEHLVKLKMRELTAEKAITSLDLSSSEVALAFI